MTTLDDLIAAIAAMEARAIEREAANRDAFLAAIKATSRPASAPANPGGGPCLPNYGRRKGEPIAGAPVSDLEYYAAGCRRSLDDPSKSRWHQKERDLLAAIEAEIARQSGGSAPADAPALSDDDLPF